MTERYWEPGELPTSCDVLKDWVSENVVDALQQMIDEGHIWFNLTDDGNLSITFVSFDMPEKEGELSDLWHKEFTLLDIATEWARDYAGLQSLSPAQQNDLEERAKAFDRLAAEFRKAAGLPSNVELTGAARLYRAASRERSERG